jgi:transmembrane sensor
LLPGKLKKMNRKRKNIIPKSENRRPASRRSEEELSRDILSRMEIPFARSKAESWTELQKRMNLQEKMESGDVRSGNAPFGNAPFGNAPSGNAPSGNAPSGNAPSGNAPSGNAPSAAPPATGSLKMSGNLQETGLRRSISGSRPLLLAAASLSLLLAITAFLRYHTKTVATGAHTITLTLPDNSKAELAKNSTVSWHPLWWRFERQVTLDGEALFTVQKGKTFTVSSEGGTTEVLGTTFRVTAHPEIYQVTCYEGSVKVTGAGCDVAATLTANEQVIVYKDGRYSITLIGADREAAESGENEIPFEAFRSVPVQEVFGMIARQYGITINAEASAGLLFTGNLQFNGDPEKLLNAVCRPLELRYEKTAVNEFVILNDNL